MRRAAGSRLPQFLKPDALKGARIGIPRAFYYDSSRLPGENALRGGLNPDQKKVMDEAIAALKRQGAAIVDPAEHPQRRLARSAE